MGGATLEDLRSLIDYVDKDILDLLRTRLVICEEIGRVKADEGLPIKDVSREELVLERAGKFAEVFKVIIRLCREAQGVK